MISQEKIEREAKEHGITPLQAYRKVQARLELTRSGDAAKRANSNWLK